MLKNYVKFWSPRYYCKKHSRGIGWVDEPNEIAEKLTAISNHKVQTEERSDTFNREHAMIRDLHI